MTSRIQEDGDGKEAKWADIDDDEDDWAPESIEWNDGTKITLTQTEPAPSAVHQDANVKPKEPSIQIEDDRAERESPRPPVSKPSSIGPNATVLKIGANSEKHQVKSSAPLSRGPNDKPTLTPKTNAPARSPWAQLPPVDKVPPVAINPPVQGPQFSRFPHGHLRGPDGPMQATSAPAKQIAADDFNRSWRESQSSTTRELFNSQSGRYEPVPENRRNAGRNEQHFRPSSLLQRPVHEQPGPAEPSPAFQTHRSGSTQDMGPWTRRRTSSNVSGGSGTFGRRLSLSKSDLASKNNDYSHHRRGSLANGGAERSMSPNASQNKGPYPLRGVSPSASSDINKQNRAPHYAPPSYHGSLTQSATVSTSGKPDVDSANNSGEDPVALQQRIMREKRDLARQRRKEEEEREELAKQERIRQKLQAMGPPPSSEKPATKESPVLTEPTKEAPTVVQSPPKPPIPEPSGEPKQYGMMKVHHPDTVKKLVAANERLPDKPFMAGNSNRQVPSPPGDAKLEPLRSSVGQSTNGVRPSNDSIPTEPRLQSAIDEKPSQWKVPASAPTSYTSWTSQEPSSHIGSSSLWTPQSSDKTLGNGTFDRGFPGFASRDLGSRGPLGLAEQLPIGPANIGDRLGASEPLPPSLRSNSRDMADNGRPSSPLPAPQPIGRPGPIGPPTSQTRWFQDQGPRRTHDTSAWHGFHAVAAKADAEENEKFHRELAARREEEARSDIKPSLQVNFNETWRKVETGDQAGQRNVVGVSKSSDIVPPLPPLHGLSPNVGGLPFPDENNRLFAGSTGRESRFFPNGNEQTRKQTNQDIISNRSSSPPPPDDVSSHPVFTGDSHKPLVHLPTPRPRVKLPPRHAPPPQPPATFASVASTPALRAAPQPIASTSSWQDRFNGLFGKKASPPKKHVLAVASATKEPLEVQSSSSASVSLPQYDDVETFRDSGKPTSKEVEDEEAIFEDREAGSLPVVRVPNMAPRNAWHALPASQTRLRSKYQKPVQSTSVEPYFFGLYDKDDTGNIAVTIRFPWVETAKALALPKKAGSIPPPRSRPQPSTYKGRKNPKSRDTAGRLNSTPQASRKK